NPAREYEDDFLYVWFLMKHAVLEAPRVETQELLRRYEAVLEGADDVRLSICRALLASDAESLDAALAVLLEQRRDNVEELIARGVVDSDASTWLRHFALEGVALLKLAERQGMKMGPRYLHCPAPLREESPFEFALNAWMEVDHRAPRRGS
ncbi:MAG: immunity 49 family protein, partial [Myxococcales bacterium]|nr:immunity 49 family protein [Myxococcales bacterium]